MTSAWFLGNALPVAQDESAVRSTVEPIRTDPEEAQSTDAPDWNENETDASGQLTGLSHHTPASAVEEVQKFKPWWTVAASADYSTQVNNQISTAGTAAAREENGVQGHGTMQYTKSVEPVIRDGGFYGSSFFSVDKPTVQDGQGNYMTPSMPDHWGATVAQDSATKASRKAYQDSLYSAFLRGD